MRYASRGRLLRSALDGLNELGFPDWPSERPLYHSTRQQLDRFQSEIKRTGLQNVSVPAGTHEGSVTISDAVKRAEGPFGAEDPIYAIRGAEDGARSHRNELAFSVGHRRERILRCSVGPMANHVVHQSVP